MANRRRIMTRETSPFGDITKMMEQFKLPGIDMTAIIESRRKDIEALVEANKAAFESTMALGARQSEMFKEMMQGIQEAAKSAGQGAGQVDPVKQGEVVRKAWEKALADMQELAELMRKSQADAMARITQRANEHMAEIKKLMQPK
jgi:phasin family protein